MSDNNHFSESVTFTAEGLDQVIEQTRLARQETDQLTAAQYRAAKMLAMRQQAQQRVNQTRVNQPTDYGRPINSRSAFGGQPMTVNGSYGGTIAGVQRVNQPIRINAQSVQIVGSSFRDTGMSQAERVNQRQQRERVNGGGLSLGSAGSAAVAAGVLAKGVANAGKQLEKFAINQKGPKEEANTARGAFGLSGGSSILATSAPEVKINQQTLQGLSASAAAAAKREMMADPRADAQERFKQAINYNPANNPADPNDKTWKSGKNLAFEAKIADPISPNSPKGGGLKVFSHYLKESLNTLTVDQLKELASEADLPNRSKVKKKDDLVNFLGDAAVNQVANANQVPPTKRSASGLREQFAEEDSRRQYVNEMRQLTSTSAMLRRNYDQARAGLDQFGKSAKAWATSPEMTARLNGARAWAGSKWEQYGDQAKSRAGYAALGVAGTAVGMGMAGLQQTVTGQRFNNEVQRLQLELANVFGPALRKATEYLGSFSNALNEMSPRQQRNLMYAGLGITGYGALRAAGMGGLVEKPLGWAADAGLWAAGKAAPHAGQAAMWAAGKAAPLVNGIGTPVINAIGVGGAAVSPYLAGAGAVAKSGAAWMAAMGGQSVGALAGGGVLGAAGVVGAAGAVGYGGYKLGEALSPYLLQDGIDNRDERTRRQKQGLFDDADSQEHLWAMRKPLEAVQGMNDPEARSRAARNEQKRLLKEQSELEGNYSWFGRQLGTYKIPGIGRLGSYGAEQDRIQTGLNAFERIQIHGDKITAQKNQENLAGGGFEGFLDTYRRTEEAVGKIDPGLMAGGQDNKDAKLAVDELVKIRQLLEAQAGGEAKKEAAEPPKFVKAW